MIRAEGGELRETDQDRDTDRHVDAAGVVAGLTARRLAVPPVA